MNSARIINLRMKPIVYPEDIQCVYEETPGAQTTGRIYISNLEAAQNKQTLKSRLLTI